LHSYQNPDHEHQVLEWLEEELPDLYLCASADILPVFREYERTMATVINAYSIPRAFKYFESLKQSLTDAGIVDSVFIMKSNGGVCSVEAAKEQPVFLALSGPAAGVVGARRYGAEAGTENLITIDIGGTSADISLIANGQLGTTVEGEISEFPLSVPMVDVHTIGAGGGSIARVTETGSLVVGPESAGAEPGPACYGRGGTEPTVTDAHLVLGRITDRLLGGEMKLDVEAARSAINEKIAKPLNLSLEEAAEGILTIINNDMMGMLRLVSVEKGHDPKKFSLMPFGGAGSLHGVELAQLMQIPEVIIPPGSGVLSAFGLLQTDVKQEFSQIVNQTGPDWDKDSIVDAYRKLDKSAMTWLEAEAIAPEAMVLERSADLRYAEQGFELTVEYDDDAVDPASVVDKLVEAFHAKHEQLYTYSLAENEIEIVTVRVAAVGKLPRFPISVNTEDEARDPRLHTAKVHFQNAGGWIDTAFYQRERMRPGYEIPGPAIILQSDSTLVLPPATHGRVDDTGNIIVRISD
ncbi:MAG: hydantoinase/oxoprolinase family protein, partial [Pseudomonadales bacterium]